MQNDKRKAGLNLRLQIIGVDVIGEENNTFSALVQDLSIEALMTETMLKEEMPDARI